MSETLIFDSEGIGVTMNSPLAAGQFAITIHDRSGIAHFPETPKRYRWDTEQQALVERPEWAQEEEARESAAVKSAQLFSIASQRYAIETGGVMFGEYQILTDRESQQILDSAIEKIRRGLVPSISWKCGNGKWLTLDVDNIAAVEVAVLSHVQGAFAWEKAELERFGLLEE